MEASDVKKLIKKNPGLTCAKIAEAFETEPALVSVHLRALKKAGEIRSKGNTRGTKYTAAGK
jgi:predicted transcriptional regulator